MGRNGDAQDMLTIKLADEYLEKYRVSQSWRLISNLRDALVRVIDERNALRQELEAK